MVSPRPNSGFIWEIEEGVEFTQASTIPIQGVVVVNIA